MHTRNITRGNFKALNQFYHEPGHTFHHALLYLRERPIRFTPARRAGGARAWPIAFTFFFYSESTVCGGASF